MANDNKYIPALRFPEFQNDGEWGLASVGIYYKVQGGFAFKSGEFKDSGIPVVRISNIPNNGNYVDTNNCVYYDRIPNEKSFLIAKGDLLIAMSGATTGKTAVYNKDNEAYLNQRVGLFKSTNSQNYYPFICQWVKTELFQNQLKRTLAAGAQPNISSKDIESFTLIYPTSDNSSNEQKKIADCLSSLDSYIDATKRKLEQLREHKKGLMQRLFPAKGKTTPELRFPEFQNEGEWQAMSLGEITFVVNRRNKSNRSLPIYSINNADGFVPQSQQFAGMDGEARGYDISAYKIIGKHTFAYNPARINVGSIGYSGELKDILISSLYVCFKTMDNVDDDFLMCFFNSYVFNQAVESNVEGGIRSYLFYENFSRIKMAIPSLYEQKRIASCIASVEKMIKKTDEKISLLEMHKKGLQQQLFPKINKL